MRRSSSVVERFLGKKEVGSSILPIGLLKGRGGHGFNSRSRLREIMPAKKPFIKLQCSECKRINYYTRKSKKIVEKKFELKKFCKWCRKHTIHKEAKR